MNLACFIHGEWAYGSIHHELVKFLHPYGINGSILCWEKQYSPHEIVEYEKTVDLFLTVPQGTLWFYQKNFSNPNKFLTVFHSKLDLLYFKKHFTEDLIKKCNKFGAVSKYLIDLAKELELDIEIELLPLGINFARFYYPPNTKLQTVGYAGIYHEREVFTKQVSYDHPGLYKRSYLVKEIAESANLKFKLAAPYHKSFVTMAGYYPTVDCVICSSLSEGAGLPVLEAGAAGKLVLTTEVGHFVEKVTPKGAIPLPFDEPDLLRVASEIIMYYKHNKKAYYEKCLGIQEHAKTYDWKNNIEPWVKFILNSNI